MTISSITAKRHRSQSSTSGATNPLGLQRIRGGQYCRDGVPVVGLGGHVRVLVRREQAAPVRSVGGIEVRQKEVLTAVPVNNRYSQRVGDNFHVAYHRSLHRRKPIDRRLYGDER